MKSIKTRFLLVAIVIALQCAAFGEVKTPQILAKPMGTMIVKPLNILECVLVWTNYGGARLDFKGTCIRGGSSTASNSLDQYAWRPFLSALKRARDSKAGYDEHIRWDWPKESQLLTERAEDTFDVRVVVTPVGRYYRLKLQGDVKAENRAESLSYEVSQQQLLQLINWVESALDQVHKWPKPDPNPWNDPS